MTTLRPSIQVAVIMRRKRTVGASSRWQPFQWGLADVVAHEESFGSVPRMLFRNDDEERWLHPGFTVTLFSDDAEGYYLNVTTDAPCWWVMWRMEEEAQLSDEPVPLPQLVSLSYHDAGRLLDAQEKVEQVPASPAIVEWVQAFVDTHYQPEPRRRQRPESFKSLQDRFGNPASVSTGKKYGGRGSDG
ncbi:MAG: DUF3305 domain-containing protein [Burkholderiales bacterium]|nr:DUF3305 domain-containing protein [Burkholderiales bacterium]